MALHCSGLIFPHRGYEEKNTGKANESVSETQTSDMCLCTTHSNHNLESEIDCTSAVVFRGRGRAEDVGGKAAVASCPRKRHRNAGTASLYALLPCAGARSLTELLVVVVVVMILVLVLAPACYGTYVGAKCLLGTCRRCIPAGQSAEEEKPHRSQPALRNVPPVGKGWLARTQACVDSYYGRILEYPVLWYRR